ncbi:flagellar export protein FliJ [Segnochrobactraceae bacterium EtOH-i3]
MKPTDTLIKAKRFDLEEARRKVMQLETMIAEFERMSGDLQQQIASEEARAGISDPHHYAYPTFARAARQRRDNILASLTDLQVRLAEALETRERAAADYEAVMQRQDREDDAPPRRTSSRRRRISVAL